MLRGLLQQPRNVAGNQVAGNPRRRRRRPPHSLLPFFLLLLMSESFPFSFCRMFSPTMNRSFKKKMNQVYDECPAAWQEVLDRRTNASPVALTKGYTASPGTTGLAGYS